MVDYHTISGLIRCSQAKNMNFPSGHLDPYGSKGRDDVDEPSGKVVASCEARLSPDQTMSGPVFMQTEQGLARADTSTTCEPQSGYVG